MDISAELGGIQTITVAVIIITGILGNILAELVCKVFRLQEPIAKGLAIGTSSHAIGTVKAMEMGEIEGAMSSLAIAVAGLMTVGEHTSGNTTYYCFQIFLEQLNLLIKRNSQTYRSWRQLCLCLLLWDCWNLGHFSHQYGLLRN